MRYIYVLAAVKGKLDKDNTPKPSPIVLTFTVIYTIMVLENQKVRLTCPLGRSPDFLTYQESGWIPK